MALSRVNSGFEYSRTRWLISVLDAGFSQAASSSTIFSGAQSALVGTHAFLVVEGVEVLEDDSQREFIGQYDVQVKTDSCDVILVSSPPELDKLDTIISPSNRIYVCTSDALYYVNKEKSTYIKLDVSNASHQQFIVSIYPSTKARTLSEEEVAQIHVITKYFPKDAAKEIKIRCRENAELDDYFKRDPTYYKSCRSKTHECSREEAQKMLADIRTQASEIAKGSSHVPYKTLGREGWFTSDDGKINCVDWCIEKLAIAGIGDGHGKSKPVKQTGGLFSGCRIL